MCLGVDKVEIRYSWDEAFITSCQLKLLNEGNGVSQHRLLPTEVPFLQEAIDSDVLDVGIRFREGEYQYALAKTIASFEFDLCFPDVKGLVERLYGAEKTNDIQFIRKIQTILKKMEKSNIVRILPKKRPWELQRYALLSFKFRDSDKNLVNLALDEQLAQMKNLLHSINTQANSERISYVKLGFLFSLIVLSYSLLLWSLMQPVINFLTFVAALSVATICSLMVGKTLSRE
jgi:hypothetical protein